MSSNPNGQNFDFADGDFFANLMEQQQGPLSDDHYDQFFYQIPEQPSSPKKRKRGPRVKKVRTMNTQDDNDQTTKNNNLKNTYINKITSLIQQDSGTVISSSKFKEEEIKVSGSDENAKLNRNRECARNSRKRKKIYIELLENKVRALNEEIDKTNKILKTSDTYCNKMSQNQQLQGFFLGRQQLFEKLDKQIQESNIDRNELNLLLDSMRFRVGGGGKERVNACNYFFNQILEICFPMHVRYVLSTASKSKDIFAEKDEDVITEKWIDSLQNTLQITDLQRKVIKKSQRRVVADKHKLGELLGQFQDCKEQLYNKTAQLENFLDELRSILTPLQVAKFLLYLEKVLIINMENQYKKELSIDKLWALFETNIEINVKEEDDDVSSTKKVHI